MSRLTTPIALLALTVACVAFPVRSRGIPSGARLSPDLGAARGVVLDAPGDGTCEPEDCTPARADVVPFECRHDNLPLTITRRVSRARDLLGHMARLNGRGSARRLGMKAAKELRQAAASATRRAALEQLSEPCAQALRERLEGAGACAACCAG